MTERVLRRILAGWQKRLRLEHWDVKLDLETFANPGCYATVWAADDYDTATVKVDAEWRGWSTELANQTVVHELLHIVFRDVDEAVCAGRQRLSDDAAAVVKYGYEHALEGTADRLAHRLVELGGCVE